MDHIAEVIESTAAGYRAILAGGKNTPSLGSMLLALEPEPSIIGVVTGLANRGLDPTRHPVPHGLPREQLLREMPQLSGLLVTELTVQATGEKRNGIWRQGIPALPLPIHTLIITADVSTGLAYLGGAEPRFDYLRLLLAEGTAEADGATRAHLDWLAGLPDGANLVRLALRELGRLLARDYQRLRHLVAVVSE